MLDLDNWLEIHASLKKNRLRTLLTSFGVFWGIFMLVVMLGSGNGLENGIVAGFGEGATNSLYVWARRTSKPFRGLPPNRSFELNNGDFAAIRESVPEAHIIAPRNQLGGFRGGNNVTRGLKTGGFSVMGDYPQILAIQPLDIVDGRFVNHLDLEEKRKVAVIGTRVRDILFEPDEEPIGGSIRINGVYFKVIGVTASKASGDEAERANQTLYVPFTTFQTAFNYGDDVGWFAITSAPGVPVSAMEEKVFTLLRGRHRIAPNDTRAIGHYNSEEEFNRTQGLFSGIGILVWIVGTGTLAAGIIGVSNIMLIIVKERTKEIGIRRAIGATPLNITGQIVLEAVVLTSVAGYLGLLAGIGLVEGVRIAIEQSGGVDMFRDPGVSLSDAFVALLILVGSGVLAGLIPAQRAISVSPVVALHSE